MASESYSVKAIGKLCEGKPHAQFDEGALETERWRELYGHEIRNDGYRQVQSCTSPRQCSTLLLVHCHTKYQAEKLFRAIENRFHACNLKINKNKTRIIYCKDSNRKENHPDYQFDFLGYTFRPRSAFNSKGDHFVSFTPAASKYATKSMRKRLKLWLIHRQVSKSIDDIATMINPTLRGWINYYGKYYPSELTETFSCLNKRIAKWASKKFKNMRARKRRATEWLIKVSKSRPDLFAHWQLLGITSFHW